MEDIILNYFLSVPLYQAMIGSGVTISSNFDTFELFPVWKFQATLFSPFSVVFGTVRYYVDTRSSIYHGLRLPRKEDDIIGSVDNDSLLQAVTFSIGRTPNWDS